MCKLAKHTFEKLAYFYVRLEQTFLHLPILQCVVRPRSPPVSHLLGHPLARNFRRCGAWCAQSRPPNMSLLSRQLHMAQTLVSRVVQSVANVVTYSNPYK